MVKTVNKSTTSSAYIANLSLSGVSGMIINGWTGGSTLLSTTIIDEFLITRGYILKHYLTSTALWTSLIILSSPLAATEFFEYKVLLYSLYLTFALGIAYFSSDPLNFQKSFEEIECHLVPVIKLFDDHNIISTKELKILTDMLHSNPHKGLQRVVQDIYYFSSNELFQTMSIINCVLLFDIFLTHNYIKYLGNSDITSLVFTLISQKSDEDVIFKLFSQTFKISLLWCGKNTIQSTLTFYKNYLEEKLAHSIHQKSIDTILLNPEHLHKMLQLKNISEVTYNLPNDFNSLFAVGSIKLIPITIGKIKELMAFNELLKIAPEVLILSQITGLIKKKITNIMQKKFDESSKEMREANLEHTKIVADLAKNFSNAVLTENTEFIKFQYFNAITKKLDISIKIKSFQYIQEVATNAVEVCNKFFEIIYYSYKIISGGLTLEQVPIISALLSNASSLLQGGVTLTWAQGNITLERIKEVLEVAFSAPIDQPKREYNSESKITISDYFLKLNDHKILTIQYLELTGIHCAITGISGIGKTSLLKDLKGYLNLPLKSIGIFSFPQKNHLPVKILFIDQTLYIPTSATLFQAITVGLDKDQIKKTKDILKAEIILLFKQLKIDAFAAANREDMGLIAELENQEFNTDNLSGGQKKKIGIIKAIITKPDLLFADEIFVGLDPISVFITQSLLKQHLPDSKIIIVDHAAHNNNYQNFYNNCIELLPVGYKKSALPIIDHPHSEHYSTILGENE